MLKRRGKGGGVMDSQKIKSVKTKNRRTDHESTTV